LSTGNELRELGDNPTESHGFSNVVDTNRPSLALALESAGYQVVDLGIVRDDFESTAEILQKGLREADVIITTGGTSMGESDFLKSVIERRLGGEVKFGRVAVKPG
jgi:gephyrin